MKERFKVGNRISCVIEDIAPNYILVAFKSAGNLYRGVLINEDCSTVRRTIPDNYFPVKAVLDQETTDNLRNEITNRALDTKSKGLRSSKTKQSCIILDDYDFVSDRPIPGKSPIDSLCGLVESIDARSKELSVLTSNISYTQSVTAKPKTILSDTPLKPSVKETFKVNITSNLKDCESQNPNIKKGQPAPKANATNKKESIVTKEEPFLTIRGKKRKLGEINTNASVKLENSTDPQVKKVKNSKVQVKEHESKAIPNESLDVRKKRKKVKRIVPLKRRKNKVVEDLKNKTDQQDFETGCKTIPLQGTSSVVKAKPKRKSIAALSVTDKSISIRSKKPVEAKPKSQSHINKNNIIKPKRVDPIIMALKNIRNYESLRRNSRISTLNMVTRRTMIGANEDPYSILTNKRKSLRERIAKNRSLLKKKNAKLAAKLKKDEKPSSHLNSKEEAELKSNIDQKTSTEIANENEAGTIKTEEQGSEGQHTEKDIQTKTNLNAEHLQVLVGSSQIETECTALEEKPDEKFNELVQHSVAISEQKLDLFSFSKLMDFKHQPMKKECLPDTCSPGNIDLLCHENGLSPEEAPPSAPILPAMPTISAMEVKRRNRRKPLHVFKSLPNPALEENRDDGNEKDKKHEYESEERKCKGQKLPVKKSHNTRFRGNKSVVPSHMSPRRRMLKAPGQVVLKETEEANSRNSIVQNYAEHSLISTKNSPNLHVKPSPIKRLQRPSILNVSVRLIDEHPVMKDDDDDDDSSVGSSVKDDDEMFKMNGNTSNDNKKTTKKRKKHVAVFEFQKTLKPLTRCNNEVRVGDVIWGKILGYGWWPGVVVSNASGNSTKQRSMNVSWMSSNTSSVMAVKELELFLPNFNKRFDTRKTSNYVRAVTEAQQACASKYGLL